MSEAAVKAVIEEYVAACQAADVRRLKVLFHLKANTWANIAGDMQGEFLAGEPAPFFAAVASSKPCTYDYQISQISVAGNIGAARLDEQGYMGMDFTNYFLLARTPDGWRIVGKVFHVRS